jgi:hypothetical protein
MAAAFRDVEAATLALDGSPPITRTTFPTCRAHYPGGSSGCACRLLPRSCSLPPGAQAPVRQATARRHTSQCPRSPDRLPPVRPCWWAHCTSAPILSFDDASAVISASHVGQLSDGQSLVRRTLPGSLAVSTELANRAVSSICLAGLCDWSLACVSFGFDPLSSSSTVGFRGILVSPWPFTVPTLIQRIGCGTCARFCDNDYNNGKLLDGLESMRRRGSSAAKSLIPRMVSASHDSDKVLPDKRVRLPIAH